MKTKTIIKISVAVAVIVGAGIMIRNAQARVHVPTVSVERLCSGLSDKDVPAYNACITEQQVAYDALKAKWAEVPLNTKIWCEDREFSSWDGLRGYPAILACVNETREPVKTFDY